MACLMNYIALRKIVYYDYYVNNLISYWILLGLCQIAVATGLYSNKLLKAAHLPLSY